MNPSTRLAEFQRGQRAMLGPEWRWKTARALPPRLAHRAVQASEPLVRDARGYLTLVDRGPRGLNRARRLYPAIAAAVALNADATKVPALKIMTLAGCAATEIHARLEIVPDVVETWEKLFFDARDQRGAVNWLSSQVIHAERRNGNNQLAAQLTLALTGGVDAARALLDAESRVPMDEGQRLFDRQVKLSVKFEQAIAMPLASSADSLRFLKFSMQVQLQQRRLELDQQKLALRCRDALRQEEVARYRMQQAVQREARRAAERTRKCAARTQRKADAHVIREYWLGIRAQQRSAARRAAEVRAANSPLAQLKWGSSTGAAPTDDSRATESPVFTSMLPIAADDVLVQVPVRDVAHVHTTTILTRQDGQLALTPVASLSV